MELRPHQKIALEQLTNGTILWGAVGSGKSRVAAEYYHRYERPKDVYVITTAKKRDELDWDREFIPYPVSKHERGPETGLLTVDSWNNLHKYVGVEDAFFIFDEQRLVGSGKWVKSFLKIVKNNRWILLSATPGDTWMDYVPVFIANGFYKNRTQFKREHVVYKPYSKFPKIDRYLNESLLEKHRDQILVKMPYPKLTVRHPHTEWVGYNEELLNNVVKTRWNIYKNRPIKDIAELWLVMRRVINSDPSRLRRIRELLDVHPKMVVFYNFDYELELLRGLQSVVAVSEWNGHNHEPIPTASSWAYLVQYVAGSEGWNCVETNSIAYYSLTYSYKMWEQSHGRIDRLNSPFIDLYYYTLRSKCWVDDAIWKSLKAKKNFNAVENDPKILASWQNGEGSKDVLAQPSGKS